MKTIYLTFLFFNISFNAQAQLSIGRWKGAYIEYHSFDKSKSQPINYPMSLIVTRKADSSFNIVTVTKFSKKEIYTMQAEYKIIGDSIFLVETNPVGETPLSGNSNNQKMNLKFRKADRRLYMEGTWETGVPNPRNGPVRFYKKL